jgi:PAS domain S-box-containing protein
MSKKPTYEELEQRVKEFEKEAYKLKQIDEALQESEERFRLAFENANDGVCLVDTDGNLIKVNERMCDIFGYSKKELESMTVTDIAHPEDKDISPKFIKKSLSGEVENTVFEKRYFHKQGHIVWGQVSSSMIKDAKGDSLYFISHVQDITQRRQAEEALRESERKYQDLYDNAPDMFVSIDAKTATMIQCNQTLANVLGYKKEEIIGRPIFDLYTPDSAVYAKSNIFPVFVKTGTIKEEELQLQRKDGSTIDTSLNVSAVKDEKGNILLSRSIFRDITKRKQAEEEREKLIKNLQEALQEIKTLRGILPLCSFCKKIRDDKGYWEQVDVYIHKYSQADISHSICPDCAEKHYPDLELFDD